MSLQELQQVKCEAYVIFAYFYHDFLWITSTSVLGCFGLFPK